MRSNVQSHFACSVHWPCLRGRNQRQISLSSTDSNRNCKAIGGKSMTISVGYGARKKQLTIAAGVRFAEPMKKRKERERTERALCRRSSTKHKRCVSTHLARNQKSDRRYKKDSQIRHRFGHAKQFSTHVHSPLTM